MRRIGIFLAITLFLNVTLLHAAPSKGVLDGKTYVGEKTKKGDKKGNADSFVFKEGTFRSTASVQLGYSEAPYVASNQKKGTTFTATTQNKDGAKITWKGKVNGDAVQGKAIMLTKAGEKTHFKFHGKLQN